MTAKGHPSPLKGIPRTEEVKKKISASNKGISRNKGMPSPKKGTTLSAEHCARISEARKGQPSPKKGIPLTAEHRAKVSESNKGISRNKGIPLSAEHRKKISIANKGQIRGTYKKRIVREENE
jgi:hypothetical protein